MSNNVQVLLFPDASKPQFTLNVTVLVGSRHEGYGETGMAHLLEHMLFKGTEKYSDIPELLKDRGVLNMNGTTSYDRTNYFETLPSGEDNLQFAIEMEADRLVNSLIRGEDLASEMTVVRSEFERGENSPQRMLFQRILANAYEWHNYGKSTIGNREDIMRVPVSNLRQFYKKFYQPDNIMVVLAGKFDTTTALQLLEENFGALKTPDRELPKTYTEEPSQDGERLVTLRRTGDSQMVGVGYHVMSAGDPDYVAGQVLTQVLSTEPSGLLYKNLVETNLASSVFAQNISGYDPGMLVAMAQVSADVDIEKTKSALIDTIESLDESMISDAAVSRAINQFNKNRERQFANTERMAINLSEWRSYGDWRLYFLHRDRMAKVTRSDVLRVAKRYLVRSNRTLGIFQPTDSPVRAATPNRPDLAKALNGYEGRKKIAEGEAFEATLDNIAQRTTTGKFPTGIKYALLPKKTRGNRVQLTGEIHFGDAESLKGLETACQTLPQLLTRGTSKYSFQEFKDELDRLGGTINFRGSLGTLSYSVESKSESFSRIIAMMKEALRNPLLEESELDVLKRRSITQMEMMKSDPGALAFTAMTRTLAPYSPGDIRYSPTITESIERFRSVSIEDIRRLQSEFLNGRHGAFAVVGQFEKSNVLTAMQSVLDNWNMDANYTRVEKEKIDVEGQEILIDTPDKKNAIFMAGLHLPISNADEEYEPLLIGNYILGGGPLSSRLADRVRKKEGLSYTINSRFSADAMDELASFRIFAISNPANSQEVQSTIDEELSRFVESGVSGEELTRAKVSYLKTVQGRRARDGGLARLLLSNLRNDRTTEFQKESELRIEELQKDQVNDAIKQSLKKENLVIIRAGDFGNTGTKE